MQGFFAILQTAAHYVQGALSRSQRDILEEREEKVPWWQVTTKKDCNTELKSAWCAAFQPSPNERTVKLYSLQSIDISLTQQPRFFFHQHVKLHWDAGQTLHKPLQIRARITDVLPQSRSLFDLFIWLLFGVHFLRINYSEAFGKFPPLRHSKLVYVKPNKLKKKKRCDTSH